MRKQTIGMLPAGEGMHVVCKWYLPPAASVLSTPGYRVKQTSTDQHSGEAQTC